MDRNTVIGRVVSAKMDKTVAISMARRCGEYANFFAVQVDCGCIAIGDRWEGYRR